jgi:hypothetical protein
MFADSKLCLSSEKKSLNIFLMKETWQVWLYLLPVSCWKIPMPCGLRISDLLLQFNHSYFFSL